MLPPVLYIYLTLLSNKANNIVLQSLSFNYDTGYLCVPQMGLTPKNPWRLQRGARLPMWWLRKTEIIYSVHTIMLPLFVSLQYQVFKSNFTDFFIRNYNEQVILFNSSINILFPFSYYAYSNKKNKICVMLVCMHYKVS